MKALVTGAAGFIGHHLVSRLLEDRAVEVVGIDSFTDYYDRRLKEGNVISSARFELIDADLMDVDLRALLADVEFVFHQAGQPGVRPSWGTTFNEYARCNVLATQRLLEAALSAKKLRRFVYASSSSVYGSAERYPTSEHDRPMPRSPYGVTKLAAEHLCSLYAENFGLPTVSLRYFTVYGPRQRPDMAFTRFIDAALNRQPIVLYGDGTQVRDFTYVTDVVAANLAAAQVDVVPGQVINVAGGSSVAVNEVISMISQILNVDIAIQYEPTALGDVQRTGGDTDRARRILGWQPSIRLYNGLERQAAWLKSE